MKQMKKTTTETFANVLRLTALTAVMLLGYQNCGPGVLNSTNQASTTSTGTFTVGDTNDDGLTEVVDLKAVGVSYSENTFTSMQNQTGVVTPSNATRTAVTNQFTKLSETGKSDSVTAPMWVSITTVAGELCNDLVNQERALTTGRRFFGSVDFARAPNALTASAKDDVIRRLARSFWARNETAQEKTLIQQAFDSSFSSSTTVADTQSGMMFLCTAMLSSLDAHKY